MARFKGRDYFIIYLIAIYIILTSMTLYADGACNCLTAGKGPAPADCLAEAVNNSAQNMSVFNETAPKISHTIMHPMPKDIEKWMGRYKSAARAYLSPQVKAKLAQATGAHFSLLDYLQYNPSERDQGGCGDCWAWAGTGVMEIDNAYQTGVKDKLSVQYINSNFRNGKGSSWACCGGWLEDVADFYSSKRILIPWSNTNARWQDGSQSCEDGATSVPARSIETDPHYDLVSIEAESIPTQGVGKDAAIANIKNILHQGKAIWFGYFLPDNRAWNNFFSFWDSAQESSVWQPDQACGRSYNYREGGGHAVLCVGYDDTDPKNRYWIMLNSWGSSSNRPNGLFLMNMDMNYDCTYGNFGAAFYWMTLNISYPIQEKAEWNTTFGGLKDDRGISISQTSDEGYIIAGDTHSFGSGKNDAWILKADSQGKEQWNRTFGGLNDDQGIYVLNTSDAYILAGMTQSFGSGKRDAWLLKTDLGGKEIWNRTFGGPKNEEAHAMLQENDGYLLAGYTESFGSGGEDVWLLKTDLGGKEIWNRTFGGPEDDEAYSVLKENDGYIIVGMTQSLGSGGKDTWLLKTDLGGKEIWNRTFGGHGDEEAYSILRENDGYILAGNTKSFGAGGKDAWLLKTDLGGNELWNRTFGGNGDDVIRSVLSENGSYILAGWTESYGTGNGDLWLISADSSGKEIANSTFGGTGHEEDFWPVQATSDGRYILTGWTDSYGSGGYDAWLIKSERPNSLPDTPSIPSGPDTGFVGNSYNYSTLAIDRDFDRVKYTFDWGDKSTSETDFIASGMSANASHSWKSGGTYYVKAKATDSRGALSDWSFAKAVAITRPNSPPNTPVPSGPSRGYAWTSYSYSAFATDPERDQVKYAFDWGDGNTSETGFVASGLKASQSHTWSTDGTYYVKAKAIDRIGASSEWSGSLAIRVVANKPPAMPSIPSGPDISYNGTSYRISTSTTDPDRDLVKYTFDWGDGSTSATALMASGMKATGSHLWSAAGTYYVKAKATDSRGASSEWSLAKAVTITTDLPPDVPALSGSGFSHQKASYSCSVSATDPEGDDISYTLDWGDGSTSKTGLIASDTSTGLSHSWQRIGAYYVKAKAVDSKGASSSWSRPLAVKVSLANSPPSKPTRPAGPSIGRPGAVYRYITVSKDPNGGKLLYTFDWGDGTTSEAGPMVSGRSIDASHNWSAPGTYQVTSKAEDDDGVASDWSRSLAVRIFQNGPENKTAQNDAKENPGGKRRLHPAKKKS